MSVEATWANKDFTLGQFEKLAVVSAARQAAIGRECQARRAWLQQS